MSKKKLIEKVISKSTDNLDLFSHKVEFEGGKEIKKTETKYDNDNYQWLEI